MEKKTVLITGSNKGIGFETARQLGKKGYHVILSGRDEERLERALEKIRKENISSSILQMDVSQHESILQAAKKYFTQGNRLDILINNAAILLQNDHKISESDESVFTETLLTNCYGPLRVIRAFLPCLGKGSRIINISSGGGSMTDPVGGWSPAYCVSKSLLASLTRQLAYELSGKGISVNAVCPGWVQTDMGGAGAPRSIGKGAETPVWLASEAPGDLSGKFFRDKSEIPW
jgi:NAD(P)-dependent dehydrogenase (short-subunit alcohol dehydrogenase family)